MTLTIEDDELRLGAGPDPTTQVDEGSAVCDAELSNSVLETGVRHVQGLHHVVNE